MKQISHKDLLLVEVPEGTFDFKYHYWADRNDGCLSMSRSDDDDEDLFSPGMKGNYSIVGLAKDLTEEQWQEIVDRDTAFPRNFWRLYNEPDYKVSDNATDSGHSLIKHHGFELSNCLILKKIL